MEVAQSVGQLLYLLGEYTMSHELLRRFVNIVGRQNKASLASKTQLSLVRAHCTIGNIKLYFSKSPETAISHYRSSLVVIKRCQAPDDKEDSELRKRRNQKRNAQ